jgi:hypothetical protein
VLSFNQECWVLSTGSADESREAAAQAIAGGAKVRVELVTAGWGQHQQARRDQHDRQHSRGTTGGHSHPQRIAERTAFADGGRARGRCRQLILRGERGDLVDVDGGYASLVHLR